MIFIEYLCLGKVDLFRFGVILFGEKGNVGDLSVRQQNMTTFIEDVLGQAASRQGRYKSISVAEQQQARQMLREFRRAPENVSGNLIGVDLQGEVLRVSPWARN